MRSRVTFPSYKIKNLTLVVAIGVVVAYILVLLFTTRIAQDQLRERGLDQVRLSLAKQAAALGYYYEERRHDLASVRKSQAVRTYFVNRDLGMSMKYGLRASLVQMEDVLEEVRLRKRIDDAPVYRALAVYDEEGVLLAASAAPGEEVPARWTHGIASEDIRIRVEESGDALDLLLVSGIPYRNRSMAGTLVARVDHERAFARLTVSESVDLRARFIVGYGTSPLSLGGGDEELSDETRRGLLHLLDKGAGTDSAAEIAGGNLGVYTAVPNTPFWIVGLYPVGASLGLLSSSGFFNSLAIVALAVLGGAAFLMRVNTKNLVLRARLEEWKRQEALLSAKNSKLEEEIERRREYEQRLLYQANFDQLTGLPNRVLAIDRLSQAIKRADRIGSCVLLVFADLDRFKQINDSLGHAAGDRLLIQVADRLGKGIRASDTVARFGGDEFVLICTDISSAAAAQVLAENVLRKFADPFTLDEHELHISTSLGLALYPQDGVDTMALLKNADTALYKAKDEGRSTFCFFTPSMNEEMQGRMLMEAKLRHAIERCELSLKYQPQVCFNTGEIIGFEALLRWNSRELGEIPPGKFIPLAEESGLIEELGTWVLYHACREAQEWQTIKPVRLAVNVSSRQLRASDRFFATVEGALRDSGLEPSRLELEITENVLLEDLPEVTRLMKDLDRLGVRLALDDFGTGYSALSYLKHLPFDLLKIDRSFVQDSVTDPDDAVLVRAILAMAQALHMEVVGEGVETAAQAEYLRVNHCDFGQGFHFSRPVPSRQVMEQLRSSTRRPAALRSVGVPSLAHVCMRQGRGDAVIG